MCRRRDPQVILNPDPVEARKDIFEIVRKCTSPQGYRNSSSPTNRRQEYREPFRAKNLRNSRSRRTPELFSTWIWVLSLFESIRALRSSMRKSASGSLPARRSKVRPVIWLQQSWINQLNQLYWKVPKRKLKPFVR